MSVIRTALCAGVLSASLFANPYPDEKAVPREPVAKRDGETE